MDSTAAKITLVVLALIGALVLLSAFGMFFMHSSMMGGVIAPRAVVVHG